MAQVYLGIHYLPCTFINRPCSFPLMLSMLGKNFSRRYFIFFSYFTEKLGFDIPCKFGTVCMKFQIMQKKKKQKKTKKKKNCQYSLHNCEKPFVSQRQRIRLTLCEAYILSSYVTTISLALKCFKTLRKHAYSNILKILPPKNGNFQMKNSDIFIFLL